MNERGRARVKGKQGESKLELLSGGKGRGRGARAREREQRLHMRRAQSVGEEFAEEGMGDRNERKAVEGEVYGGAGAESSGKVKMRAMNFEVGKGGGW